MRATERPGESVSVQGPGKAGERRSLGRLEDIPEGEARGFPAAPGGFTGLFAVRRNGALHVYVNACPHVGLPLEPLPHRFLDTRKQVIICSAHGARFRIEDGTCITGPCVGEALEAVAYEIVDGQILVPADAGV